MANGAWLLIVVVGIILILFSLLRRRSGPDKHPEVVQALLYDVKLNQALAKIILQVEKPRRFENTNWEMNKNKIGFLGESLKAMLKEIYVLVEEYNKIIQEAKKTKSDSYRTIDLTRFKELLDKCRQELEDWMVQKTGSKELPPKYPTLMGSIFGER